MKSASGQLPSRGLANIQGSAEELEFPQVVMPSGPRGGHTPADDNEWDFCTESACPTVPLSPCRPRCLDNADTMPSVRCCADASPQAAPSCVLDSGRLTPLDTRRNANEDTAGRRLQDGNSGWSLSPRVDEVAIDGVPGKTTFRLKLVLDPSKVDSCYSIFGDQRDVLTFPPAYQVSHERAHRQPRCG